MQELGGNILRNDDGKEGRQEIIGTLLDHQRPKKEVLMGRGKEQNPKPIGPRGKTTIYERPNDLGRRYKWITVAKQNKNRKKGEMENGPDM